MPSVPSSYSWVAESVTRSRYRRDDEYYEEDYDEANKLITNMGVRSKEGEAPDLELFADSGAENHTPTITAHVAGAFFSRGVAAGSPSPMLPSLVSAGVGGSWTISPPAAAAAAPALATPPPAVSANVRKMPFKGSVRNKCLTTKEENEGIHVSHRKVDTSRGQRPDQRQASSFCACEAKMRESNIR